MVPAASRRIRISMKQLISTIQKICVCANVNKLKNLINLFFPNINGKHIKNVRKRLVIG